MILLKNSHISLSILPEIGGSFYYISYYSEQRQRWFTVTPKAENKPTTASEACNFLMAPYSNRIRDGKLQFREHSYQLARGEKHSIHGDVRNRPWQIKEQTENSVVLTLLSNDFEDFNYPWKSSFEQRIELTELGLKQIVTITNEDKVPFPVGIGFHPYFLRDVFGDGGDVLLQFNVEKVFPTESDVPLPTGAAELIPESLRYSKIKELEFGLDHCFELWDRKASFQWRSESKEQEIFATVRGSDSCAYVVVYSPLDRNFFAFEPVTHAIDSFNLFDTLKIYPSPSVIEPGGRFSAWWDIAFSG